MLLLPLFGRFKFLLTPAAAVFVDSNSIDSQERLQRNEPLDLGAIAEAWIVIAAIIATTITTTTITTIAITTITPTTTEQQQQQQQQPPQQ